MIKIKYILIWKFVFLFLMGPSLYAAGGKLSGFVFNDADRNQKKDITEKGTLQTNYIKLCKNNTFMELYEINASNTAGYYEFNITNNANHTLIKDDVNTTNCTSSSYTKKAWSSSTSNYISVKMAGLDIENQNFGSFKDDQLPLDSSDMEKAYLFQNRPSDIFTLDLVTGKLVKVKDNVTPHTIPFYHVNALGFNVTDGFLWGSTPAKSGYISRIGKNGSGDWVEMHYGPIKGLNLYSYTGDINDSGTLFLYSHNSGAASKVDLNPNSKNYLTATDFKVVKKSNPSLGVRLYSTDWAINPVDNMLYTVNNGTSAHFLWRIDPATGYAENLGDTKISNSMTGGTYMGDGSGNMPVGHPSISGNSRIFGGSFFTSDGFYYLYDNGVKRPTGEVFRIDISNPSSIDPSAVPFSKPRHTSLNDGVMFAGNKLLMDFGDAPDGSSKTVGDGTASGNYRTMLADNGPRHKIPYSGAAVYLGDNFPDDEDDAKPSLMSDGDNNDDGVKLDGKTLQGATINAGTTIKFDIKTNGSGFLNAWVDWESDGNFTNSDKIAVNLNGSTGSITIPNIHVPTNIIKSAPSVARFRYSSDLDLNATGPASDGEVEDYMINISVGNKFGVWDTNESITHQVVRTKKVNKDINLTIASLDSNGSGYESNVFSVIQAAIYTGNVQLSGWEDVNLTDKNATDIQFGKINRAAKIAYVAVKYGDANSTRDVNLSEKFAIRPDRFIVSPIANSLQQKAGASFDLNITAVDEAGIPTPFYNENNNTNKTFSITFNEQNISCLTGDMNLTSLTFNDGKLEANASYSEAGQGAIQIEDNSTHGFAAIDINDTNNALRLITSNTSNQLKFNAANFDLNWSIVNNNGRVSPPLVNDITYLSNNPIEMGARLSIGLTAVNKQKKRLKNYTAGCYANDINTTISIGLNGTKNQSYKSTWFVDDNRTNPVNLPKKDNVNEVIISNLGKIKESIVAQTSRDMFKSDLNGSAITEIDINLGRNSQIASEPVVFTITDINSSDGASDTNNSTAALDSKNSVRFYYGRIHSPDYQVVGADFNATMFYEVYCRDCDRTQFSMINTLPESADSVFWYILDKVDYDALGSDYNSPKSSNNNYGIDLYNYDIKPHPTSNDRIKLKAPKTPYNDRITYKADTWLLHNRFGNSSEDSFLIEYASPNTKWDGKGKAGKTVNDNMSRQKARKMDW